MSSASELPRRNGQAVLQALEAMTKKIEEQQVRIDGLNNFVATLSTRVNAMEYAQALDRASSMGRGPTVK